MKPNIGTLNALIRITIGLTLLSWATASMSRRFSGNGGLFAAVMGAMKVAEGITRFCPITKMLNETVDMEDTTFNPNSFKTSFFNNNNNNMFSEFASELVPKQSDSKKQDQKANEPEPSMLEDEDTNGANSYEI